MCSDFYLKPKPLAYFSASFLFSAILFSSAFQKFDPNPLPDLRHAGQTKSIGQGRYNELSVYIRGCYTPPHCTNKGSDMSKGTIIKDKGVTDRRRFDLPRFLRWVLILIIYLVTFSALDFLSQTLQIFPGVVAWYPPDGLSLAFLLTFGVGFIPAFSLASLISSLIVYRLSTPLVSVLFWAVMLPVVYGIDVLFLRHRARFNPQMKNRRDTLWLIFSSAIVSMILGIITISGLVNYGEVPSSQSFIAFVQWWIGEMIGILVFTPFLLIHVMPWLKRFIDGKWENTKEKKIFHKPSLRSLGQVISIPIVLYLVFGIPALSGFQPYYLIAGPLIWIALTDGFSRVSLAIVAMNFGTILAFWLFKFDNSLLGNLQFLLFGIYASILLTGAVVTKQKRTEEELREKEARTQALIENAPDGIILLDAEGLSQYISPSGERILGYASEEWIGRKLAELTHPDDLSTCMNILSDMHQTPEAVVRTQYRFRHKDGSWRWLESTFTNRLAEPGIQAIVLNFKDVTEHKQVELELQTSQEYEKYFSERMATLSEVTTELSTAEGLNDLCRRAVEAGRDRLDFDRLSIWFFAEDRTFIQGTFGVDAEGQITDEREQRIPVGPNDSNWSVLIGQLPVLRLIDAPLLINGVPIGQGMHVSAGLWDGNTVIGCLNVDNLLRQRPFSDRDCEFIRLYAFAVGHLVSLIRAGETLQKSEKHFRSLVEHSLEEISLVDADGTLLYESPSMRRPLGYPPNSLVGRNILELFHPDDRAAAAILLEQILTLPGGVLEAELRFKHVDGSWRWMEGTLSNLLDDPAVKSIVINYRDITERKRAEQEIAYLAKFPSENPNIVLRLNRDGIVIYANPASEALVRMWGCAEGGPVPQFWRDLANQALLSKENKTIDIECEGRFIELIIVPVTGPEYVNLYGRDITERKKAEEAMQLSEEKYRTLVDEVNDGFYITDAAESSPLPIQRWLGCMALRAPRCWWAGITQNSSHRRCPWIMVRHTSIQWRPGMLPKSSTARSCDRMER